MPPSIALWLLADGAASGLLVITFAALAVRLIRRH